MKTMKEKFEELGLDKEYFKKMAVCAGVGLAWVILTNQRDINKDIRRLGDLANHNLLVVQGAINDVAAHSGMEQRLTIA